MSAKKDIVVKVPFWSLTVGNLFSMITVVAGGAVLWGIARSDVNKLLETANEHSQQIIKLNTEGSPVTNQRFTLLEKTLDIQAEQIRAVQTIQLDTMGRLQSIQTDLHWIKDRLQQRSK